jgi:predicted PurR-regulated permease PerM
MNINTSAATRVGLSISAALGVSVALYLGRSIFIPLVFAILLAVMLYPAAHWLRRKFRLPWFFACSIVISLMVVVFGGVFTGFALAVPSLLQEIPNPQDPGALKDVYKKVRQTVSSFLPISSERVLPPNAEDSRAYVYIEKLLSGGYITDQLLNLSKQGLAIILESIVVLFVMLFLLLEGDMLAARIKNVFGKSKLIQSHVGSALNEMAQSIRSYLVWRTVVNIGLGAFLGVIYYALGLNQPWTWALLTVVLCYVPYIGTIIAGVPPVLDAIIHTNAWIAVVILILYIIISTVEGYIIVPVVMGRSMDLNATTVMLACLFWDFVWGTPGLFLAMPIMAGIRAALMHVEGMQAWAILMSTERTATETEKAADNEELSKLLAPEEIPMAEPLPSSPPPNKP